MVMKPEPWGLALDEIVDASAASRTERPTIIFPSPAGEVFTQKTARDLATREHLIFGCGRYEGIDERVFEYAAERGEVRLISLGDYVLNGGEVATMAMIEAIGRLIPGVVGNPESLVEVPRGWAARVSVVHQACIVAGTSRSRCAAERKSCRDRGMASGAAARAHQIAASRSSRRRRVSLFLTGPRRRAQSLRASAPSRRRSRRPRRADAAVRGQSAHPTRAVPHAACARSSRG